MSDRLSVPHLVVIGGGLSGTMLAIHMLRDHPLLSLRITIIDPRARLGAGLAYGTSNPHHRINVAASRMSIFSEDPQHFDRWVCGRLGDDDTARLSDGRLYPRRGIFGAYLADVLDQAVQQAGPRVTFRHLRATAVSAGRTAEGYLIGVSGGEQLLADRLVIATGHAPPAPHAFLEGLPADAIVRDPWADDALSKVAREARVLVVGTGLTASDVLASLAGRRHTGPLVALSRHGLLPRPRTSLPVQAYGTYSVAPPRTALDLLRRVRLDVSDLQAMGRPWEDAIDALRRDAARIWAALPVAERRRLLRHLKAFWDVHRFQSAPQVDDVIEMMRKHGQLRLVAGRVLKITPSADGLSVSVRRRHQESVDRLEVDVVVNCTGPGSRSVVETNAVLRALAAEGALRADPLALGLDVDLLNRALPAAGQPDDRLFVAGPLARSAHGELMGLPQVSNQPRAIASSLAGLLGGGNLTVLAS